MLADETFGNGIGLLPVGVAVGLPVYLVVFFGIISNELRKLKAWALDFSSTVSSKFNTRGGARVVATGVVRTVCPLGERL